MNLHTHNTISYLSLYINDLENQKNNKTNLYKTVKLNDNVSNAFPKIRKSIIIYFDTIFADRIVLF